MPAAKVMSELELTGGGKIAVLTFGTHLVGWEAIDRTAVMTVENSWSQGGRALLVDMEHVTSLEAEHLAFLLRCWWYVDARGGRIALCCLAEDNSKLLKMTALDGQFRVYADRTRAIEALLADCVETMKT